MNFLALIFDRKYYCSQKNGNIKQFFQISIVIFCQVLAHSWEWIKRNNNNGLMALSEEALESKQKSARSIRKFRCFQGDVMKNLVQAHQTMQLESDMFLNRHFESRNFNVSLPYYCYTTFILITSTCNFFIILNFNAFQKPRINTDNLNFVATNMNT